MNLLMLSGDLEAVSGQDGAFFQTLKRFAPYWTRIDVITPRAKNARERSIHDNVYMHPSPWHIALQPFFIWDKGNDLLEERNYDLIISHDFGIFYNGMGAWLLTRRHQIPIVSEIHHVEGYPFALTRREWIYREWARVYLRWANRHVRAFRVVNQFEIPEFLREHEIPAEKILVLLSAYLDFDIFFPQPKLEKKYDVLFVGRFAPNKGILTLLEAVAKVKQVYPEIKLCLMGRGQLQSVIEAKIKQLALEPNVVMISRVDLPQDVARLYNQSKMLVCASTSEGGPRVTLEAMACGTPVISTPVGIMKDLMESGLNFIVFAWHADPLAEKIRFLLDHPLEREQVGKNGEIAVQGFRADHIIFQYARAYQELIKHDG